ncbi:MAG: murein biosynthesis integral membrane protein MurJ [Betaproteobacteria bacterium]|nr:murein biosynthesis integral membrane protein MurJ [Betaproteobacteria bacterium]
MNILKAALSLSSMTLLSRITGLAREVIGTSLFGAGAAMDAFQVAWRIPNFLRRLFAEGAFSQAFVPVFAEYRTQRGITETRLLADQVASLLGLILFVVTLVGVIAAPLLIYATASGFSETPSKFALTVQMARITFPYLFFISLVSLAAGILNTFSAFKTPAFTPVLLNLSVIAAAWFLSPYVDPPILALAWGTLLGGMAQLLFQIPALRRIGVLPRLSWLPGRIAAAYRSDGVRRILGLMLPAILGVSVAQVSMLINTQIASHLGDGAVSWITLADRLMEFPSALLGVALGTVLLPSLAKQHAANDPAEYSRLLDWGLRVTLLLTLPAALGLALLATPLISTIFQNGKLLASDVLMTRSALIAYAVGLTGIILVKILAPGFYARQNVKTPVKIAIVTLLVTQVFNLAFVPLFRHAGLALATGLGACVNAGMLYYFIRKQRIYTPQPEWLAFIFKLLVALYLMAGTLWWLSGPDSAWLTMSLGNKCLKLGGVIMAGATVYFVSLGLMGFRLRDFIKRVAE